MPASTGSSDPEAVRVNTLYIDFRRAAGIIRLSPSTGRGKAADPACGPPETGPGFELDNRLATSDPEIGPKFAA